MPRSYKRPRSRSEEIARFERAERNLAIRLGEIPRPHSVSEFLFERVQSHFVDRARAEQQQQIEPFRVPPIEPYLPSEEPK